MMLSAGWSQLCVKAAISFPQRIPRLIDGDKELVPLSRPRPSNRDCYPSLVVEVLSPATEARDRGQKSLQYRSCPSIQEYLLISSEFPLVEVFRREKHGFWTLYTLGPDDAIELTSLGIRFPLAEVYQNTSFMEKAND
jgi:Uma2 family endonuclease